MQASFDFIHKDRIFKEAVYDEMFLNWINYSRVGYVPDCVQDLDATRCLWRDQDPDLL